MAKKIKHHCVTFNAYWRFRRVFISCVIPIKTAQRTAGTCYLHTQRQKLQQISFCSSTIFTCSAPMACCQAMINSSQFMFRKKTHLRLGSVKHSVTQWKLIWGKDTRQWILVLAALTFTANLSISHWSYFVQFLIQSTLVPLWQAERSDVLDVCVGCFRDVVWL